MERVAEFDKQTETKYFTGTHSSAITDGTSRKLDEKAFMGAVI